MTDVISTLCNADFYSNGKCGANNSTWWVGPTHSLNGVKFTGNFRAQGLTDSMQVNTNVDSGSVQIDIDRFNPASTVPFGAILHGLFQVLPNQIIGTDNSYGCGH